MKEELLIRYIMGDPTPEERQEIIAWISEQPEHQEAYYKLKNLWGLIQGHQETPPAHPEDLDIFLNQLRKEKLKKLKRRVINLSKYAAIFIFTFLAARWIYHQPLPNEKPVQYNEVNVPAGQMAQLVLSDGTKVSLNSCSSLKYPANFSKHSRKVKLAGEAYFNVARNPNVPFIVETPHHAIRVTGTQFNVMAYPQSQDFFTTLIEGKITMLDTSGKTLVQLRPGEQFQSLNKAGEYRVHSVKTSLYISWKDGLYQFDHETLKGLSAYLERIFAVKINIHGKAIENYKFTGTISRNVPFEQILKIIQITSPISYNLREANGAITEANLYSR